MLEASAGTGKTFALAGLVTRYVAEGAATLDQMLLITFGRAASQELRERVRDQIVDALAAFDDPSLVGDNQVVGAPAQRVRDDERATRHRSLRDALASFDAATIATTHQFCQLVLQVARRRRRHRRRCHPGREPRRPGRPRSSTTSTCAHFGQRTRRPAPHLRATRCGWPARWSSHPSTELRPLDPEPGSRAAVCVELRERCSGRAGAPQAAARHPRLRRPAHPAGRRAGGRRLPGPDADAPALADRDGRRVPGHRPGAVAGDRPRVHRPLDADPDRRPEAGDLRVPRRRHRHLPQGRARPRATQQTLGTNWRSDGALVDRLQVVLRGAALGDPRIVVHDVDAHHRGSRLAGAPC